MPKRSKKRDPDSEGDSEDESVSDADNDSDDEGREGFDSLEKNEDSFGIWNIFNYIDIKVALFVFIIFMAVTSTTFNNGVLGRYPSCVDGITPTIKGTAVQGACAAVAVTVVIMLDRMRCI